MSRSSIVRTLLAATFVASLCTACSDSDKGHAGISGSESRLSERLGAGDSTGFTGQDGTGDNGFSTADSTKSVDI